MIGIIAAMESELEAVRSYMKEDHEKKIASVTLHYGTIGKQEVVLLQSGIGKVLAGMAATIACMEQPLDALINVGVAGGLKDDQHVMDLVISSAAVQADYDTTALDGEEGRGLMYEADPDLVCKAQAILEKMDVPCSTGLVASQDLFMARDDDFARLMRYFPDSACSEMEGAAIAAVASQFSVPFLIIRSLSDVVHHSENHMEFSQFAAVASRRAALLVRELCEVI